jgi:hypothetical protein
MPYVPGGRQSANGAHHTSLGHRPRIKADATMK